MLSFEQIPPFLGYGNTPEPCITIFPVIYGWNGSAYADMSTEFPGYYRKTLEDLQHEISSPPASLVSSYEKRHLSLDSASSPVGCDRVKAAEIERFLGISPDTGLEQDAIRWSQSNNKIDRLEAIQLFSYDRYPAGARLSQGDDRRLRSRGGKGGRGRS